MNQCVLSNPQPSERRAKEANLMTPPSPPPPRWTTTRGSRAERRSWNFDSLCPRMYRVSLKEALQTTVDAKASRAKRLSIFWGC
jgi:hypothetical protein